MMSWKQLDPMWFPSLTFKSSLNRESCKIRKEGEHRNTHKNAVNIQSLTLNTKLTTPLTTIVMRSIIFGEVCDLRVRLVGSAR